MDRAIELALASEREGNLPVGAVIVLDGEVIAEGHSAIVEPTYHPGRHAEMVALDRVADDLWPRAHQMTCYTTLEPCMMCAGALLLHGIGRVVFGARDPLGGAGSMLDHLPPYYAEGGVYDWEGPLMQQACEPLYRRTDAAFAKLPVGRSQWSTSRRDETAPSLDHLRELLERWREGAPDISDAEARCAADEFAERLDPEHRHEAIPYLAEVFERTGYLKDFRRLKRWARRAGRPEALERVDETIRHELPDVWIARALERGQTDAAVACWFEQEGHRRLRLCADRLVRACGEGHIDLLISCRMSQVNYRIGRKGRRHYRRACAILRRLRDELEQAAAADYWRLVIEDITTRFDNRPALIDEMQKAGFIRQ